MKIIAREENTHIIRFGKHEDVIIGLANFCKKKKMQDGTFAGLGAYQKVVLSYYDLGEKNIEIKYSLRNSRSFH